jgi:CRISPR-associated protein Cas2
MPEPRYLYVLAYDVSDPGRLRKVHKTMTAWGKPLQQSVFRVRSTVRELERLRFELTRILDADDRLMVVRLCPGCAARVSVRGKGVEPFETEVVTCRVV